MTGRTTTSLWDRFAGFDPGLIRLTSALRAVLGTAATLALLTALRAPETALVVGGFTAMTTSLAISDLHPRNQLITLGLGLPLSLACLAVGTALTPYPTAAKLTFLVLICLRCRPAGSAHEDWAWGSSVSWPSCCPSSPRPAQTSFRGSAHRYLWLSGLSRSCGAASAPSQGLGL